MYGNLKNRNIKHQMKGNNFLSFDFVVLPRYQLVYQAKRVSGVNEGNC